MDIPLLFVLSGDFAASYLLGTWDILGGVRRHLYALDEPINFPTPHYLVDLLRNKAVPSGSPLTRYAIGALDFQLRILSLTFISPIRLHNICFKSCIYSTDHRHTDTIYDTRRPILNWKDWRLEDKLWGRVGYLATRIH